MYVEQQKNLNYFIVSIRVDKFSTCSIQIMRKITFFLAIRDRIFGESE